MALIIIIIICIYILVNAKNLGNRNRFDHNPTRIDLTSLDNENIELKIKIILDDMIIYIVNL